MKTFSDQQQKAVLRAIIRHRHFAFRDCIAKAIFLCRRYFTNEKYRAAIVALINADFRIEDVPRGAHGENKSFLQWAEKVKGGAL
jgi:hypothetical protein